MLDVKQFAEDCHKTARSKGWWDKPPEKGTSLALMHSELSEALEALRKPVSNGVCDCCDGTGVLPQRPGELPLSDNCPKCKGSGEPPGGTREAEELADVVIRIFDYCGYHNIDIERALIEKAAYNLTRSYKHGKEF